MRAADKRIPTAFNNDAIHHILHVKLIKDFLLPIPHRTCHKREGGQLKEYPEPLSGQPDFVYVRWRKGWLKTPGELAQDRRSWDASIGDALGKCRHKYRSMRSKGLDIYLSNPVIKKPKKVEPAAQFCLDISKPRTVDKGI